MSGDSDLVVLRELVGDSKVFQSIVTVFGGRSIYIPQIDREARRRRILARAEQLFSLGMDRAEAIRTIAREEHLTAQYLRKIIKRNSLNG